jgi:hypothetical protein
MLEGRVLPVSSTEVFDSPLDSNCASLPCDARREQDAQPNLYPKR